MWTALFPPPYASLQTQLSKPVTTCACKSKFCHNKCSSIKIKFRRTQSLRVDKSSILSVGCSASSGDAFPQQNQELSNDQENKGFWQKWKENSSEMSSKLAKLGLAAVLAYGIFDGITYTSFFVLAFLGYEKSTGKNPAANLQALLDKPPPILSGAHIL